jgi:hypothetical protein
MIFKTGLCKTRRTKILERSYHKKNGGGWRRVSAASIANTNKKNGFSKCQGRMALKNLV